MTTVMNALMTKVAAQARRTKIAKAKEIIKAAAEKRALNLSPLATKAVNVAAPSLVGAGVGAVANPEDRLGGAMKGGLVGAGIGAGALGASHVLDKRVAGKGKELLAANKKATGLEAAARGSPVGAARRALARGVSPEAANKLHGAAGGSVSLEKAIAASDAVKPVEAAHQSAANLAEKMRKVLPANLLFGAQ